LQFKLLKAYTGRVTTPDASALSAVESQQLAREIRGRLPKPAADISIRELALARQSHESWEKRFGEVVRGWRQDRNWSQEDVAEKLRHQGFEMHQTTIAKLERGTRPLRVAEATAIAKVLGMPIMAVFEVSLPGDRSFWVPDGEPAELRQRQEALETARRLSDRYRDKLYAAGKDYAFFLGEVEKLVLKMNEETADKVRNDPEA
jgi:transcriptional regulator with XRE-family HTH domain